ncbi:MAG: prolyl oligopeptidase family serine peptidase [Deltaproteobacteria bacterium]|nr:prolyl oligopeptidase family serine peptidase [Deltaproteobacteria bacterium]
MSHPFALSDELFLTAFAQTRAFLLGRPVRPTITPDGSEVLFLRSGPRSSRHDLFSLHIATGQERLICTAADLQAPETLSTEEKARRERQRITDTGLVAYELSPDGRSVLLPLAGVLYLLDRQVKSIRRVLPESHPPVMDARFTPDGHGVAFVSDHNLYVAELPPDSKNPVTICALTTEGSAERFFGMAEFVAQEEMSRFEGYWFSPDGTRALVAVVDESAVEAFAIADPARPERTPHSFRYPRPGKANADVGLQLISRRATERAISVVWDKHAYPYLARVLWQCPDTPPALWVQSRDQRRAALLSVDVATGTTSPLFEEYDEAWINLDNQLPRFLPQQRGLLHVTEAPGARELQLRSPQGALIRTLVPADAGFLQFVGADVRNDRILVLLGDALYSRPAWVPLSSQASFSPRLLPADQQTDPSDRTSCSYSTSAGLLVETRVCPTTWPTMRVLNAEGALKCVVPDTAEAPPFSVKVELTQVATAQFHAAIVRPHNFDPTRTYPVIVHVYGGPHALLVKADQRQFVFDQWLANQGAIVVAIDNRGTPRRDRTWERGIKGAFGDVPLQDQVEALQALAVRVPQMDLNRVGIYGWSFGGFMSALAALRRPDIFKVAVAGAPVVDWLDYDTHYTERYLGLPEEALEAYRGSNLLTFAESLTVPLLLIHGTADDNVYFFHSLKLADALLRAGRPFDFLPLPGTTHQIGDAVVRERLWAHVAKYLFDRL